MLKIRITYNYERPEELEEAIKKLEKEFEIISQSQAYKSRGKSKYSSIYLDIEMKK
jgi:hypothetical protein